MLVIENLLTPAEAAVLAEAARGLEFEDGQKTAGRFAKLVKSNDQAAATVERDAILAQVSRALNSHPLFRAAARPLALTPLILSRYRAGQTYGLHVDDAIMNGLRTDLSFTLFLADPDSYGGGALVVEDLVESRAIKLKAGDLVLYPSSTLHRVEPVSHGERLCVVGWVQSLIRDPARREMLFDLDQAVETVFAAEGKSALFDRLTKTRSNLTRMWADV